MVLFPVRSVFISIHFFVGQPSFHIQQLNMLIFAGYPHSHALTVSYELHSSCEPD